MAAAAGHIPLRRRAWLWDALAELIAPQGCDDVPVPERRGEVRLDVVTDESGQRRELTLFGRRELNGTVEKLPLLHLDVTMPVPIIEQFLGQGLHLVRIDARVDHARVVQVVGP